MDIKDFILIAGGLLIAAVVAHGFWIAWRARTEPLRLDIVHDLVPEDGDDMARFRGELPNGGARVIDTDPEQGDLLADMDVPVLLEPNVDGAAARRAADQELLGAQPNSGARQAAARVNTTSAPVTPAAPEDDLFRTSPETTQERVAEVVLPETPILPDAPITAEPEPQPDVTTPAASGAPNAADAGAASSRRPLRPERSVEKRQTLPKREPRRLAARGKAANEPLPEQQSSGASDTAGEPPSPAPVEELIVLHLLAPKGELLAGERLVDGLRARGLKFGAMNIFHRMDPMTKVPQYSVANAMEPGVFDLSDLANMQSVGLTFFLQLPGPEEPLAALEDMVDVARSLAQELGADVRDEQHSVLTGQAVAHLRQRISDHARKRLSKRA